MAHKSNEKDDEDKPQTCPLCGGTGKLRLKCHDEDTDICGFDVKEGTCACPLCHGSGKVGRFLSLERRRIRLRQRPRRIFLRRRRISPSRGRSGKFSRSPILLLPPGTPLAGYLEGDMIPKSTPESAYLDADIDYDTTDNDNPEEEEHVFIQYQYPRETILRISDDITITLGKEFPPSLVLDTDFIDTNFQDAFQPGQDILTAQISYGRHSDEYFEWLLHEVDPFNQPAIIQLDNEVYALAENKDQLLDLEPYEADIETHISEYDAGLPLDIENEPAPELTLQSHQSTSATFADVLGPDVSGQANPLDVTGIQNPFGFDINANVTGKVGF